MDNLPPDIIRLIMSFLDHKSFLAALCTSKVFHVICNTYLANYAHIARVAYSDYKYFMERAEYYNIAVERMACLGSLSFMDSLIQRFDVREYHALLGAACGGNIDVIKYVIGKYTHMKRNEMIYAANRARDNDKHEAYDYIVNAVNTKIKWCHLACNNRAHGNNRGCMIHLEIE